MHFLTLCMCNFQLYELLIYMTEVSEQHLKERSCMHSDCSFSSSLSGSEGSEALQCWSFPYATFPSPLFLPLLQYCSMQSFGWSHKKGISSTIQYWLTVKPNLWARFKNKKSNCTLRYRQTFVDETKISPFYL